MKILITGGQGFIGAAIANVLQTEHSITIMDNWSENYPGYAAIHRGKDGLKQASELEIKHRKQASIYREELIKEIPIVKGWSWQKELETIDEPDLIINCGSLSEAILSQYLEDFTWLSIVKGIENIKKIFKCPVLHFSSSMSYGSWEGAIKEDGEQNPVDWYGSCKKDSEAFIDQNDIIVRPMHVYGFGDGKFPMPMNIERQYQNGRPVTVEEADCIYIKDLTVVIKKIVDKWIPGVYNLSSGYLRSKDVIKEEAKNILGFEIETINKSGPTGKNRGTLDSSKLAQVYNWNSQYKNYKETIIDYFNEYRIRNENNS
tara:strand:- start:1730 stop:2677 length:948 start_codon:yes stop_codon:yes gene_type:complete